MEAFHLHASCGLRGVGCVGVCAGKCVCQLADYVHEHGEGVTALGSAKCSQHTRPGDKCNESVGYGRGRTWHVSMWPQSWLFFGLPHHQFGNCTMDWALHITGDVGLVGIVCRLWLIKNVEQKKGLCRHTVNTIRRPAIIPSRNVRHKRDVPLIPHYSVSVCISGHVDYTGDSRDTNERTQRQRQRSNALYKSARSAKHTPYNKEPNSGAGREECGALLINAREAEYMHSHSAYQIN
jgi:hypothetical protein